MNKKLRLYNLIILLLIFVIGCKDETMTPQNMNNREGTTEKRQIVPSEFSELYESPYLSNKPLPPVKERLPIEPCTEVPTPASEFEYEIGKYGGVLRLFDLEMREPLLICSISQGPEIWGNVLKGFESNLDGTEYTFYLRQGLKWSDGVPVTVEDVVFTFEDVLMNQELKYYAPAQETLWLHERSPTLTVIDDYTFCLRFDRPWPQIPLLMAQTDYTGFIKPKHYLIPFHPKYANPNELEKMMRKEGIQEITSTSWCEIFSGKDSVHNPEYPVLTPWKLQKKTEALWMYERNPYYYKVDAKGNQLPYIESIEVRKGFNSTNGQIDLNEAWQGFSRGEIDWINKLSIRDYTYLVSNKDNNLQWVKGFSEAPVVCLSLSMNSKDSTFRQLIQDNRFRHALNLAVDRQALVEKTYHENAQPSLLHTEYNLAEANRLLDDMGLITDSTGYRIGLDGKPVRVHVEKDHFAEDETIRSLLTEQCKQIGIHVEGGNAPVFPGRSMAAIRHFDSNILRYEMDDPFYREWGWDWNDWFISNGKRGRKPPAEVMDYYQLAADIHHLPLQKAWSRIPEIWEALAQNEWYLFLAESIKEPTLVQSRIRNIPSDGCYLSDGWRLERWFIQDNE